MIDIMIVDDQEIVREGLKMILSLDKEINILGEASNGEELLDLLEKLQPDVILMDVRMPKMDGVEATKIIKEKYENLKVIILTTFNEDEYIFKAIKNGADGYLLKDAGLKDIVKAIKSVHDGAMFLDLKVTMKLVAQGKSNREISNILFLAEGTVKNYVTRILEKLDLSSRTELALFLRQYYM